jgi:hypothetical protein
MPLLSTSTFPTPDTCWTLTVLELEPEAGAPDALLPLLLPPLLLLPQAAIANAAGMAIPTVISRFIGYLH